MKPFQYPDVDSHLKTSPGEVHGGTVCVWTRTQAADAFSRARKTLPGRHIGGLGFVHNFFTENCKIIRYWQYCPFDGLGHKLKYEISNRSLLVIFDCSRSFKSPPFFDAYTLRVFDMPNPYRYNMFQNSLFDIDILKTVLIDIDKDIVFFKNGHIDTVQIAL